MRLIMHIFHIKANGNTSYSRNKFELLFFLLHKKKKVEIGLSTMTKTHTPIEKSKKQRDNTKTP